MKFSLKGGGKEGMKKKLLDFTGTKISDVKQINPLFSTCKVRVLYTGKNRNMSIISKDAVEKALPSIIGVPIVGEFSMENKDYKGHGGAIDLDSYDFIHTTKPYGFVPESATFSWEEVKTRDGSIREYLTVDNCYLWTGRYPEAFSIVEQGKGQSMEIEVNDGEWNENQEAYDIKNFTFSALCILGDDVEPAFEDANITSSFSLNSDAFKLEYAKMMNDVKSILLQEKEENDMLKKLLEKYSITMEELTAKGLDFSQISEDELEAKIIEAMEIEVEPVVEATEPEAVEPEAIVEPVVEPVVEVELAGVEPKVEEPELANADIEPVVVETEPVVEPVVVESTVDVDALQARIVELEGMLSDYEVLKQFKLDIEKANHENSAQKLFTDFQLSKEDIEGLDVHAFSIEEIENKCYEILGRKLASKKNFSKSKDNGAIRLPIVSDNSLEQEPQSPYGNLLD
jgi:cell fate (sporulation/competence/biofilm development) regulator YlbF (YheA/YmcA/DUF963 family)